MLELFTGKLSLSLFSLFLAILRFGLLSHISSLRLSSGHSGLVLTLRTDNDTHASLSSPHSLVVLHWQLWLDASFLVFVVVVVVVILFSLSYVAL